MTVKSDRPHGLPCASSTVMYPNPANPSGANVTTNSSASPKLPRRVGVGRSQSATHHRRTLMGDITPLRSAMRYFPVVLAGRTEDRNEADASTALREEREKA